MNGCVWISLRAGEAGIVFFGFDMMGAGCEDAAVVPGLLASEHHGSIAQRVKGAGASTRVARGTQKGDARPGKGQRALLGVDNPPSRDSAVTIGER